MAAAVEEDRFRRIFRSAHAAHAACRDDEWLMAACRAPRGRPAVKPLVWSRRNGPWRRVRILWVGAAPGNAGGLGAGDRGAHGTRIPFGGDIAGGNLDVLLASIGITRNDTFIVASLNQLPAKGGGEPTAAEIAEPVGRYDSSVALLRDTVIACGADLVIALGNVALRVLAAATTLEPAEALRLPGQARLAAAGFQRGVATSWPDAALPFSSTFRSGWRAAWSAEPRFHVLQLLHPSAQNMSPFAGEQTMFHQRMLQTRAALHGAVRSVLDLEPPSPRPQIPERDGIYDLPEWRDLVAPSHRRFEELWRQRGA